MYSLFDLCDFWMRQRCWLGIVSLVVGSAAGGMAACREVTGGDSSLSSANVADGLNGPNDTQLVLPDSGRIRLQYVCGNTFRVRYFGTDTTTVMWRVHRTSEHGTIVLRGRDAAATYRDTTFTTVQQGNVRLFKGRRLIQAQVNHRTNCAAVAQPKLVVVAEHGVTERHGLTDGTYKPGTVVAYDFRAERGFEHVLVTLYGVYVSAAGTVTMNGDHLLIASADSVVKLTAEEQRVSAAMRQIVVGTDPVAAYRTLLAQLEPLVGKSDFADMVRRAEYVAYDPVTDSAGIRRADAALATQVFTVGGSGAVLTPVMVRAVSGRRGRDGSASHSGVPLGVGNDLDRPESAPVVALSLETVLGVPRDTLEHTTVLYVNGIFTTPLLSAATAVRVKQLLQGLPRFMHREFTYAHFYNRSAVYQYEPMTALRHSCTGALLAHLPFLGTLSWVPYLTRCIGQFTTTVLTNNDVVEAVTQYVQMLRGSAPTVADVSAFANVLQRIRTQGQHVLLVPHSQGNLLTQQTFGMLRTKFGYAETQDSTGFSVVPLAAPSSANWPFPVARIKPVTVAGDIVADIGMNQWPRTSTPVGTALAAELASLTSRAAAMPAMPAYLLFRKIRVGVQLHEVDGTYLRPPVAQIVRDSLASAYREVAAGEIAVGITNDQLTVGSGRSLPSYVSVYNQNDHGTHATVPLKGRNLAWRSTKTSIASIDAGGRVTALRPGSTTVWARTWGDSGSIAYTVQDFPTMLSGTYSGSWETLDYSQPYARDAASMQLVVSGATVSGTVTWDDGGRSYSSAIFSGSVDPMGTTATLTLQAPDPEAVFRGQRCIGSNSGSDGLDNVGAGAVDCYQVISVHLSGTSLYGTSHGVGPIMSRVWTLQKTS